MRSLFACSLVVLLVACGEPSRHVVADAGVHDDASAPPITRDVRIADRAVIAWMRTDPSDTWWVEERLAPIPAMRGDRDPGMRAIARAGGDGARIVVWQPAASDVLIDAVMHASGEWTASGIDDEWRPFLARGDRDGLRGRVVLDDPTLADEPGAWLPSANRDALRVGALSAASLRLVVDGDDVVVVLMNDSHAVLAYRVRWRDGDELERVARTLVTPATGMLPALPMGGSYDPFDAMWAQFLVFSASDGEGGTYVTCFTDRARLDAHNAYFDTEHALLRTPEAGTYRPSDVLVVRVDRDGTHAWSRVVGTVDRDDLVFGIAASGERVAVIGRSRREPGHDNTELHVMIAPLSSDGVVGPTITWDAIDSAIAQTAAFDAEGALWVGGTEGWTQNPDGLSLFTDGHPFVVRIAQAEVVRVDGLLPATGGHAELRALAIDEDRVWTAGLENGPLTHTHDADPSRVRSDAWWTYSPRE
ncbi:hypothetical protein [Sandaracinus amylolyticus]|uniref:Uncharacterized protein n=1 Tax=Sandaracinus amylolyticus TaxID=927083 RepID=A0A0F6YMJ3_9BACT|nr:hypothetical protein [Sandaracinus amylolyticus]AKF11101.1 hypothetical protein DB32_008250 [Sandaracinus amylolyticus]